MLGVTAQSSEPTVKITKPMLNSLTLPNMSEIRPKDTRRVDVTRLYPKRTHRRYWKEVRGLIAIPRNIAGREIRTIVASMAAISVPIVVFESATHLYSTVQIAPRIGSFTDAPDRPITPRQVTKVAKLELTAFSSPDFTFLRSKQRGHRALCDHRRSPPLQPHPSFFPS